MKRFGSEAKETQVEAAVLTAYFDRVEITGAGGSIFDRNFENECSE